MSEKINETLESLRVSYQMAKLDIEDCDRNPEIQFDKWMNEAISSHCDEPNACVLSTTSFGRPRGRVVLLKGVHEGSFIFYTNYESAKAQEIENSGYAAMTFLWLPLQRQVRVEGKIVKVNKDVSDAYFHKRPRGSQLGAVASPQSKVLTSRAELEKMFAEISEKYASDEVIPRPENWGGYAIVPEYVEFWQGRNNRMHDRIAFEKRENEWVKFRLAP